MSKKYVKDEEEYNWDDEYQWDDSYSEFDDRFDDVEEEEVPRKKTTKASKETAAGKSSAGRKSSTSSKGKSGKKMSAKKKKRRRMMIVVTIIEVLLLAIVCVGLFVVSQFNKIQPPGGSNDVQFGPGGDAQYNELPSGTLEKLEGYTTFAVFGIDKRNMANLDDGLSDVILLVSVNDDNGEINMVSVYRDTYLQISSNGEFGKINSAYNKGGAVQAIEALNTNLDLRIDHYVTVNWYAVAKAIDEMGGVDIEVSEDIFYAKIPDNLGGGYWLNSYIETTAASTGLPVTYIEGPGFQTLNGLQAVALCRIRQVGMDYGRADTQRQVVAQLFEKAKKTNLATLIAISQNVFPNVQTDMSLKDIADLIPDLTKYYLDQSAGFPKDRGGAMMGTQDCIIAKDLLTNVTELHRILYDNEEYVASDQVITLSEQIARASNIYAD